MNDKLNPNHYQGQELRPYEGRPGANDHMKCGTVVNGVHKPYAKPGSMCVGSALVETQGSGQRRFSNG